MNKQPLTTLEIFTQPGSGHNFSVSHGRLDPYTTDELAHLEQDRAKAIGQEAARWAANTALIEAQLPAVPSDNVTSITKAANYIEAKPPTNQEITRQQQA